MCEHPNLIIIPTEENSWGIADTYHIKCPTCKQILLENISYSDAKNYIDDYMLKL